MFPTFDPNARFREVTPDEAAGPLAPPLTVDSRFPQLIGLKQAAPPAFAKQRIVVVGVGSVGRRIAIHLARLGVAVLWLVDPDRYDQSENLLTQEIGPADLGNAKALSTGKACKQLSPATRVLFYDSRLQALDPVVMAEADAVFLATDNLMAEVEASRRFRPLGIPLVQASVHGETLVAQVRFLSNATAAGPCLMCGFGAAEQRMLQQETLFRCAGDAPTGPAADRHEQQILAPTRSTSFLCSLAADLAVLQWTRHALDLGSSVTDSVLQYCGYTHRTTQANLGRNDSCPAEHALLEQKTTATAVADYSAADLVELAGWDWRNTDGCSLTLGALMFAESIICGCDRQPFHRFISPRTAVGRCKSCGASILPQRFYSTRPTPMTVLKPYERTPLRELGGGSAAWAIVRHQSQLVLLRPKATSVGPAREQSQPGKKGASR